MEIWTEPIPYVAYERGFASGMNTYVADNLKFLKRNILLEAPEKLTIVSGGVMLTQSYHAIETEDQEAIDELDTISGVTAGRIVVIKAFDAAHTIILKNGTGNLMLGMDVYLDDADKHIILIGDESGNLHLLGLAPKIAVNSGSGEITSTATSVDITHGLPATPTRVQITPTAAWGSAAQFYVSTKGINSFTVAVDVAPGTTFTFDWRASIGEGV